MTIYRENILEIIDNWNGYFLEVPCSDHSGDERISGLKPAINAGTIELKCFINNTCPFYESSYKEDGIVFNEDTYHRVSPWFPDDVENALTVTPGMDGIHFTPRMVFRHNYIYQKVDTDPDGDFDTNYKEVSQIDPSSPSGAKGAGETRYKAEQSWIVTKSIFDTECEEVGAPECDFQARWGYVNQPVSNSAVTNRDLSYDYKQEYFDRYMDSWDSTTRELKEDETLLIDTTIAQMPVHKNSRNYQNRGVHWRLAKRTPLFKGEDFFIRFHKQATETTIDSSNKEPSPFPLEFERYRPLDITASYNVLISWAGLTAIYRKKNFAISPPTVRGQSDNKSDSKRFDFRDQAYYIIELGEGSETDNYFIIIAERANPIFVHFVQGQGNIVQNEYVSKKLSEFKGNGSVSGSQLIHADWFDVIVRNHLGKIVIQFMGKGINAKPWVIKRWDWVPDTDPVSGEAFLKDKVKSLFVPRGKMNIMGGNIKSGFIFGPLQYESSHVSFIYPPREHTEDREDMDQAFVFGNPEEISARSMKGSFTSLPFFLPSQGTHDILFSSTDIFLQDLNKNVVPTGESQSNQSLFLQDAQYYSNYYESSRVRRGYRYGGFLYGETIKDFSDVADGVQGKTSNIIVKKYRYLNDPKTRQQAFDVLIGMMAGDHIFTNNHWEGGSPPAPNEQIDPLSGFDPTALSDDQWLVQNCKTPIMASLRLRSNKSLNPRWSDGTNTSMGINANPSEGINSPYFIDATDHVMTFSDSWSASGFSEMEHTGTLNFYLDRGMPVRNNVTDALLSLQNKTFYVEIWAGYTRPCHDTGYSSYSRQNGLFKLFTGLCHGGSIDYQYGKNIMSCKVEDYTAVLKGSVFFNSPWFDGVKDINCINEIMQMAGFRDVGKYDPGSLIKFLSNSASKGSPNVFFHHFDGRLFKMEPYALPSGYNRLEQPAFRFNDGDPYIDAISKIAKRAGKIFFFDQHGIAHYENFQDLIQNDYLGRTPIVPLCRFTTNPEKYPGQLIFNKLERNYGVKDSTNHLKIISITPDFHTIIVDDLNYSSLENPESEGFKGYLQTFYQSEGMFGSYASAAAALRKYSVMFRPKIISKFETYGVPLRANDIVQINGETTRVIKVNHSISAEKNEWWMEVETEKYQVIQASRSVL